MQSLFMLLFDCDPANLLSNNHHRLQSSVLSPRITDPENPAILDPAGPIAR